MSFFLQDIRRLKQRNTLILPLRSMAYRLTSIKKLSSLFVDHEISFRLFQARVIAHIVIHVNSRHIITPYFCIVQFNIIGTSMFIFLKTLLLVFPLQFFRHVSFSLLLYLCFILWILHFTKINFVLLYPACWYFVALKSTFPAEHLNLDNQ